MVQELEREQEVTCFTTSRYLPGLEGACECHLLTPTPVRERTFSICGDINVPRGEKFGAWSLERVVKESKRRGEYFTCTEYDSRYDVGDGLICRHAKYYGEVGWKTLCEVVERWQLDYYRHSDTLGIISERGVIPAVAYHDNTNEVLACLYVCPLPSNENEARDGYVWERLVEEMEEAFEEDI